MSADRRIALWLGTSFFLLYALFGHGHFAGTDEVGVFEQTRALYENGDLSVPPGKHVFPGRDGRTYSHFAVGQSVLALPFYATGSMLRRLLPEAWVRAVSGSRIEQGTIVWGGTPEIFAVSAYAPLASALLVALFFLFERRLGASVLASLLASALLGATTYVATMSVFFLQHTTEALAILGSLYALHGWKRTGSLRALAAASLLGSLTLLIRIPACLAWPFLAGYVVWVLRTRFREGSSLAREAARAAPAVLLPFVAVLAVHAAVNAVKWGTWLWSPFLDQIDAFVTPLYVGLYGFLFSPGCSLFIHAPLLLLLPWTLPPFWRRHREECAAVIALSAGFLLVCSKFEVWSGLFSAPGPRYLFVLTPLLLLPLGGWLDGERSRYDRLWVGTLAVAGAAVQIPLMSARWGVVIGMMQWERFVPELSFVWIPDWSPLAGCVSYLRQGFFDAWLWELAAGRPDRPGTPGPALLLFGLWAAAFAGSLAMLRRSVRHATPAGGAARA